MHNMQAIPEKIRARLRCGETWPGESKHVSQEHRPAKRACVTNEVLRLRLSGLSHEVDQLRNLVDMLLVLVDPEDVEAALRLKSKTPTEAEWQEIAQDSQPPEELQGLQEEKPW